MGDQFDERCHSRQALPRVFVRVIMLARPYDCIKFAMSTSHSTGTSTTQPETEQRNQLDSGKSHNTAFWMAAIPPIGGLGFHKFYLGQYKKGLLYLLLPAFTLGSGVLVTQLIAWRSAYHYSLMSDSEFHRRVMASQGKELPQELSPYEDEQIVVEKKGFYEWDELPASLGGSSVGQVFLTNRELVLGYDRDVPGGASQTAVFVAIDGTIRGLGRAIPGLGLLVALAVRIIKKIAGSSEVTLSLAEVRALPGSMMLPLDTIHSVTTVEIASGMYGLHIETTTEDAPLVLTLGESREKAGTRDEIEQFQTELESHLTSIHE